MLGDMVHWGRLAGERELGQWMDVSGRGGGMGPPMTRDGVRFRLDGSPHARGHGMGEAGLVVGSDRFFTSLRYVQNDMWGGLRSE